MGLNSFMYDLRKPGDEPSSKPELHVLRLELLKTVE